jgi:hypothetical protein
MGHDVFWIKEGRGVIRGNVSRCRRGVDPHIETEADTNRDIGEIIRRSDCSEHRIPFIRYKWGVYDE